MDSSMSPADVYAMTNGNRNGCDGFGGEYGFFWIFALLILPMLWGGGMWGGNRGANGEPVTEAGLCNAMNFNNLENAVGRGFDQNVQLAMQSQRDMCTSTSAINAAINQARFENQQCCCDTQRSIDGTNFNIAQSTAAINANTTAQTQKILDAICGNRMADMQNQINQLQLQSALCGVVRYPVQTTYTTPCNPFFGNCGCGCGCGCNNI